MTDQAERTFTAGQAGRVLAAAGRLIDTLLNMTDASEQTWQSFTCDEIQSVVGMLEALGDHSHAAAILWQHAIGDDEGDDHYLGERPE